MIGTDTNMPFCYESDYTRKNKRKTIIIAGGKRSGSMIKDLDCIPLPKQSIHVLRNTIALHGHKILSVIFMVLIGRLVSLKVVILKAGMLIKLNLEYYTQENRFY